MSFLWGYIQTKYFYEAVLGLKFWRIITIIAKYTSWSFHSLKESTFSSYFIKRSFKVKAITKAAARKSILIYLRVIFHSSRTSQLICSVRKTRWNYFEARNWLSCKFGKRKVGIFIDLTQLQPPVPTTNNMHQT